MSFLDDLAVRAKQGASNVSKDVNAYLQERFVEPLVRIGEPATGNLSAAELKAGARGGGGAVKMPAKTEEEEKMLANSGGVINTMGRYIPFLILGLGALFIFKKGRKLL